MNKTKKSEDTKTRLICLGIGRILRAIALLVVSYKIFKEKSSFGWFLLFIGLIIQDAKQSYIEGFDLLSDAIGDEGPRLRDYF